MRCFDIVTDEGTMNNATFPAHQSSADRNRLGYRNLAAQCLSQMLDRKVETQAGVQASCCGTWNTAVVAGLDQRASTPVPFLKYGDGFHGRWIRARPAADGIDTGGLSAFPSESAGR